MVLYHVSVKFCYNLGYKESLYKMWYWVVNQHLKYLETNDGVCVLCDATQTMTRMTETLAQETKKVNLVFNIGKKNSEAKDKWFGSGHYGWRGNWGYENLYLGSVIVVGDK